jgi:hypothetical protein
MTDPVLAATTADVRKRCDELEARLRLLEAFVDAWAHDPDCARFVARCLGGGYDDEKCNCNVAEVLHG